MSESKLYLNDLLKIEDLENVKIKFTQHNGLEHPMDVYKRDPDIINNVWLFWRKERRYFNVGDVAVCLLKISSDIWLLTTIKKVTEELNVYNAPNYLGEEIDQYKPYYGRLLLRFHKKFQTQGRFAKNIIENIEVIQLLPSIFDSEDFPGYDNVRLSFQQLETIIKLNKKDWVAALENQKAVYMIRDKGNGKLYVGSATGENGMLLQRWSSYVENGHGGNRELIRIVDTLGFEYIKRNFIYSILENYNARVDQHIILERESWWKETLGTREFGYNAN